MLATISESLQQLSKKPDAASATMTSNREEVATKQTDVELSKPPRDIVLSLKAFWIGENGFGFIDFNQFAQIEKGCPVAHTGSLLHVVGDNDDGVTVF